MTTEQINRQDAKAAKKNKIKFTAETGERTSAPQHMSVPGSKTAQLDSPGYLAARWKGKAPLWKAFWLDYVLAQAIAGTCYVGLLFAIAHYSSSRLWSIPKVMSYYLVLASFNVAFLLVVSIFVWRCAPNTGRRVWTYLARIVVAVQFIWFYWKYLGFTLVFHSII